METHLHPSQQSDFLSSPIEGITTHWVDLTTLPEYRDRFALVLDNCLTPSECDALRSMAEASSGEKGWERAMINVGGGEQMLDTSTRSCGRIIVDSPDIATKIWKRIEHIPEVQTLLSLEDRPLVTGAWPAMKGEVWKFSRPNSYMRFLKYVGGEYFRPHADGCLTLDDGTERSYFTMHLYLNDAGEATPAELQRMTPEQRARAARSNLIGGATTFHSMTGDERKDVDVMPMAGRILIFQQRDLIHSGADVEQGTKYTIRTDLMYVMEAKKG